MGTTRKTTAKKTVAKKTVKKSPGRTEGDEETGEGETGELVPVPPAVPPIASSPVMQQHGVPMRARDGSWTFVDPKTFAEGMNEDDIARAQAALERRRTEMSIAPPTVAEAERAASWHAKKAETKAESLEQIVARARSAPVTEEAADAERERVQIARVEAQIPDSFTVCPKGDAWTNGETRCRICNARYVPITWELLAGLVNKDGEPALRGVKTTTGETLFGMDAVGELRRRMTSGATSDQIVLFGATGVGKSVSAAAFLNGVIVDGAERARWTSPFMLRDTSIDRALGAKTLVLDDLGEELGGADGDTGLAARRVIPVADLMGALARLRGKRLVVTTFLTYDRTVKLYGGGVARRIYDGADVIQFVRDVRE